MNNLSWSNRKIQLRHFVIAQPPRLKEAELFP